MVREDCSGRSVKRAETFSHKTGSEALYKMMVYLLLIAFLIGGGWFLCDHLGGKKMEWTYLLISGAAFVVIATLRYSIGFDYFSYQTIFEDIAALPGWKEVLEYGASYPLFAILNRLVAMVGGSYHILLLVCNLIMTALVLWVVYRWSCNKWLSLLLYVTMQFFPHSMNLLRQSMAAFILFAGYGLLRRKKFIPYLLLVLVAAGFHTSALVMIPCYFLLNLPFNWYLVGAYAAATLIGYVAYQPLIEFVTTYIFPQYAMYLDSIYATANGLSYVVVPAIYFLCVALFANRLLKRDPRSSILIYSSLFTFILYIFITRMFILERLSVYFFPLIMLVVPEMVDTFQVDSLNQEELSKKDKHTARKQMAQVKEQKFYRNWALVTAVLLSLLYFSFAYVRGFHKAYPYISIFEKEKAVSNDDYLFSDIRTADDLADQQIPLESDEITVQGS